MQTLSRLPSSFRDPGGFVFKQHDQIYRMVNQSYKENYDMLMNSGLYEKLIENDLLIPHEEEPLSVIPNEYPNAYKVLKPAQIPFISYAHEWCFGQLKMAALATLKIAKQALKFDMVLKDAPNRNIQFVDGKAKHIDTLSFEKYREGTPWLPYKQFCEHFLLPLALMSSYDMKLNCLLSSFPNGIPLDLGANLLNRRYALNPWIAIHIYLHAKLQASSKEQSVRETTKTVSRTELANLFESLEQAIYAVSLKRSTSNWSNYYSDNTYSERSNQSKRDTVATFIKACAPEIVWDLGANDGAYARMPGMESSFFVSIEQDPLCVERNFLQCLKNGERNILPLVGDISNPSPGLGWDNQEFSSLISRGPADCLMALGLIHHLVITNGVKLPEIAKKFRKLGRHLIVEFIPADDPQVLRMLSNRWLEENPYTFTETEFEDVFGKEFLIARSENIDDSNRRLYLMR